jgi:hypothetical protein
MQSNRSRFRHASRFVECHAHVDADALTVRDVSRGLRRDVADPSRHRILRCDGIGAPLEGARFILRLRRRRRVASERKRADGIPGTGDRDQRHHGARGDDAFR